MLMTRGSRLAYMSILYSTLGALLFVNLILWIGGGSVAAVSAALQGAVIASVYFRVKWAPKIVIIWALIPALSATMMWLAAILRGGEFVQSASMVIYKTVLMIVCIYLMTFASAALTPDESQERGA
jgi:hypothetical protein